MPPEGVISFEKALVSMTLASIHEVHVLDLALLHSYDLEPHAGEHVDEDEKDYGHHKDLPIHLGVLG